jgi:hypothetical protein
MKKIIGILTIAIVLFAACKKNNTQSNGTCITARVTYGGDPATDGLGWILVTDSVNWKYEAPEEIPAAFKLDGLVVDVCYLVTDKDFICFCATPPKKMIKITSISKH